MCQDFRRGLCNRGVNCRFMHGEDDDRPLVNGSYAFRPVRPDEFERQILGKNIDRAALCGCSPYSFLEGTRSETIGPLTKAGYKLKRSEVMQEQWNPNANPNPQPNPQPNPHPHPQPHPHARPRPRPRPSAGDAGAVEPAAAAREGRLRLTLTLGEM